VAFKVLGFELQIRRGTFYTKKSIKKKKMQFCGQDPGSFVNSWPVGFAIFFRKRNIFPVASGKGKCSGGSDQVCC
jgi:hypothetical protein